MNQIKQELVQRGVEIIANSAKLRGDTKCHPAIKKAIMKAYKKELFEIKQEMERVKMHEADERLLNSNWGDMEIKG